MCAYGMPPFPAGAVTLAALATSQGMLFGSILAPPKTAPALTLSMERLLGWS